MKYLEDVARAAFVKALGLKPTKRGPRKGSLVHELYGEYWLRHCDVHDHPEMYTLGRDWLLITHNYRACDVEEVVLQHRNATGCSPIRLLSGSWYYPGRSDLQVWPEYAGQLEVVDVQAGIAAAAKAVRGRAGRQAWSSALPAKYVKAYPTLAVWENPQPAVGLFVERQEDHEADYEARTEEAQAREAAVQAVEESLKTAVLDVLKRELDLRHRHSRIVLRSVLLSNADEELCGVLDGLSKAEWSGLFRHCGI